MALVENLGRLHQTIKNINIVLIKIHPHPVTTLFFCKYTTTWQTQSIVLAEISINLSVLLCSSVGTCKSSDCKSAGTGFKSGRSF